MLPAQFVIGQKHKKEDGSSRASWNTPRADVRPATTYGSRMAFSFALTSLLTVAILVSVVTVVWGGAFSEYTRANVEEIARLTSERLSAGYEERGGWSISFLANVASSSSVSDDIGMQVLDADGTILYDDTWPAASVAAEIRREEKAQSEPAGSTEDASVSGGSAASDAAGTSTEEGSVIPADSGSTDTSDAPAYSSADSGAHALASKAPTDPVEAVSRAITTSDGKEIGTLRMWVLGSDALLTKADTAFRGKTFNAMAISALVAVIISLVIGFLVSRMLTNPIRRITSTAKQIRDGDLTARTGMKGDDEIDQLGETFDEMAQSLEKDLKHERRLTSDVAHELRTPLMAMLATVEAMQDGVYPTDSDHLETVASETRRLARLVQQMLDLSRMENKTAPMSIECVDVVSLARTIVSSQHQLFHDRDLHLRFTDETQGRGATAEIDPDMITQAMINIMSNAMRYTPEDGWVLVSVEADRKNVLIKVSDTGIGIAKEDLSRIFGRFWRADASRAREAGGLGVGLAVTKGIVERHHGFISVESELGHGTTFTIHLPREQAED